MTSTPLPAPVHSFASDNAAGAHPAVLKAIAAANVGSAAPYGADPWTRRVEGRIRDLFDAPSAEILFTYGGTGANIVALDSLLLPHEAVICPASAHINTDECGAAERFTGSKLLGVDTDDGKLRPDLLTPFLGPTRGEHHVRPAVIAISQVTETGTVYSAGEIAALADIAHRHDGLLFLDGARFASAVAALGESPADIATRTGVDVLTFGGTKNGMLYGEAIIYLRPELAARAKYARKQSAQLASKMRYISAQFDALLTDDLWLENARNANSTATHLANALAGIPEVQPLRHPQANSVFAQIPIETVAPLQDWSFFWPWDERAGTVRWMTGFDTTPEDVDRFVDGVRHFCRS